MRAYSTEFFQRLQQGGWAEAQSILQSFLNDAPTLAGLHNLLTRLDREFAAGLKDQPRIRIAILGGYTTQPIRLAVQVAALALGRQADIYEAPYNSFRTEILDPGSELYSFKPECVFIAVGSESVQTFPSVGASAEESQSLLEQSIGQWKHLWETLRRQTGATVFQHNFPLDAERPLGRLENRYAWSRSRFLRALNESVWAADGAVIQVVDVADLADRVGQRHWTDPRWVHHSKHGFNPALIGDYVRLVQANLRAAWGLSKKCIVLDLDNTLWRGTIGDDGLEGIKFGMGTAAGESHLAFCHYLKELRNRGILLAVNSRNDRKVAERVFAEHLSMPLKKEDFAAFVCNWESKAANLRIIANQLNLGLESLVFLDDEPAICAEVRSLIPEVTVLEMTGDPAHFVRKLDAMGLFENLSITTEDALRARSYAAAPLPAQGAHDLKTFLTDLDLRGIACDATAEQLARVEQLLLKTNQFNLTGQKWSLAGLQERATAENSFCVAIQIRDRYVNYGLVSAVVGRIAEGVLEIENWILSCRVFSKTVEAYTLNQLSQLATKRKCREILGRLDANSRNGYARTILGQLAQVDEIATDTFEWRFSTDKILPTFVHDDKPGNAGR